MGRVKRLKIFVVWVRIPPALPDFILLEGGNNMKCTCPKCGIEISAQNYSRHLKRCDGTGLKKYIKKEPKTLYCPFCNKKCKNTNSLAQHRIRCKENPNRKDYDHLRGYGGATKGQTYETSDLVKQYTDSLRKKYAEGYINPLKGRKREVVYLYLQHNEEEIQKWKQYVSSLNVSIPILKTDESAGYKRIIHPKNNDLGANFWFEHDYIANILLKGKLTKENTVHHIDKNGFNNDIKNLMVFVSGNDHKRFHNSNYAYLFYDEETHLFSCMLKKEISK